MKININKYGITSYRGNSQKKKIKNLQKEPVLEIEPATKEQELANNFSELAIGEGLKRLPKLSSLNSEATKKYNKFIKFSI
jgi:hypothetical protein